MGKSNNGAVKDSKAGLIANIFAALVYLAVGITMLVVDTTIISTIVYSFLILAIGILFICFGAYFMIKYFLNQEFKKMTSYSFTNGVILIIIGSTLIFMAADLSVFIDAIVCLVGIVFGAVMLQQSFALFHLEKKLWLVNLIFAVATIASSSYFLVVSQKFFDGNMIACIYLIVAGTLSLLSLIFMAIGLKANKKASAVSDNTALDDSIFEEDPKLSQGTPVVNASDNNDKSEGNDSLFED